VPLGQVTCPSAGIKILSNLFNNIRDGEHGTNVIIELKIKEKLIKFPGLRSNLKHIKITKS
jgi:hypothetical protein